MRASKIFVNAQGNLQCTAEFDNGFTAEFVDVAGRWVPVDKFGSQTIPLILTAGGFWQPDGTEAEPPQAMVQHFLDKVDYELDLYVQQLVDTFGPLPETSLGGN